MRSWSLDVMYWGRVYWSNVYWSRVYWGRVNWGRVNWCRVYWGRVNWGRVYWGRVNWYSVNWSLMNSSRSCNMMLNSSYMVGWGSLSEMGRLFGHVMDWCLCVMWSRNVSGLGMGCLNEMYWSLLMGSVVSWHDTVGRLCLVINWCQGLVVDRRDTMGNFFMMDWSSSSCGVSNCVRTFSMSRK